MSLRVLRDPLIASRNAQRAVTGMLDRARDTITLMGGCQGPRREAMFAELALDDIAEARRRLLASLSPAALSVLAPVLDRHGDSRANEKTNPGVGVGSVQVDPTGKTAAPSVSDHCIDSLHDLVGDEIALAAVSQEHVGRLHDDSSSIGPDAGTSANTPIVEVSGGVSGTDDSPTRHTTASSEDEAAS